MFAIILHILVIQIIAFSAFYCLFILTGKLRVIDLYWAIGAVIGVGLIMPDLETLSLPQLTIVLVFVLWAFRLGSLMTLRHFKSHGEDPRYAKILAKSGRFGKILVLFTVFWMQALIQTILISPLIIMVLSPSNVNWILFGAGIGAAIIGLCLETMADFQMEAFRKQNTHSQACTIGLWKLSRHPNYLGEIMVWYGIALACYGVTGNLWCFLSPNIMYLLIRYVSLPMMEQHLLASKQGYRDYSAKTPLILPRFGLK